MLINNYTPVTEAYFGKSKYLVEAEKQLEIIIKRLNISVKGLISARIVLLRWMRKHYCWIHSFVHIVGKKS